MPIRFTFEPQFSCLDTEGCQQKPEVPSWHQAECRRGRDVPGSPSALRSSCPLNPSFLCLLPGWKQESPELCWLISQHGPLAKNVDQGWACRTLSWEILKPQHQPLACTLGFGQHTWNVRTAAFLSCKWETTPKPELITNKTSVARSKNSLSEALKFNSALQSEEMHLSINSRILSRRNSKCYPGTYVWNHRSLMSRWHSMNIEDT